MRIRALKRIGARKPGTEFDALEPLARIWIARGMAEPVTDEKAMRDVPNKAVTSTANKGA